MTYRFKRSPPRMRTRSAPWEMRIQAALDAARIELRVVRASRRLMWNLAGDHLVAHGRCVRCGNATYDTKSRMFVPIYYYCEGRSAFGLIHYGCVPVVRVPVIPDLEEPNHGL